MQSTAAVVLVIEDNAAIRKILEAMLAHAGYTVMLADNGQAGLDILAVSEVDLILLDIMMPGMNGFDVLKQLRKEHSMVNLPVIMVTALTEQEHVLKALNLGANDYLSKPVNFRVALARINTHIALKNLAQQNRDFVSITSHDLKKNLAVIQDVAEVLTDNLREKKADRDVLEMLGLITASTKTMKHITEDFLELRVVEEGKLRLFKSEFNINDLIDKVLSRNNQQAVKKSIGLMTELSDGVSVINADSERLEQVLENLIGNAIKFSQADTCVRICSMLEGDCVRVEVVDEGPGFSEDELEIVFDKFAPISNRPTGGEVSTGLGLTICKQFIGLHNGEIGVRNNPTSGATFWFSLPVK
jgi:signal transduction histidine kinase